MPPSMHSAAKLAAERDFISLSDYVRRAVACQLRADGFDPHDTSPLSPISSSGPADGIGPLAARPHSHPAAAASAGLAQAAADRLGA